jgi:hypothetical protein
MLVRRAIRNGRDAPVISQALAFVDSNHGMAVADVNRYQHETPRPTGVVDSDAIGHR